MQFNFRPFDVSYSIAHHNQTKSILTSSCLMYGSRDDMYVIVWIMIFAHFRIIYATRSAWYQTTFWSHFRSDYQLLLIAEQAKFIAPVLIVSPLSGHPWEVENPVTVLCITTFILNIHSKLHHLKLWFYHGYMWLYFPVNLDSAHIHLTILPCAKFYDMNTWHVIVTSEATSVQYIFL